MIDTFSPAPGWALVKAIGRDRTPAGIHLPENMKGMRGFGRVAAVTAKRKKGKLLDYGFGAGDMIVLPKFNGQAIEVAGETFELIQADEVIAKLEGTPEEIGAAWVQ